MTGRADDPYLLQLAGIVSGRIHLDTLPVFARGVEGADFWPRILRLSVQHGLGPMLLWRVSASGLPAQGEDAWGDLIEERREAAVHYMLASRTQAKIQATFDTSGIPCVWLKGIVLAPTVYPKPELRPMVDVDVLVPYARRQHALVAAESAGYRSIDPLLFDGTEDLKHHYHLRGGISDVLQLELHFRLLGAFDRLLAVEQLDWFWNQTQDVQMNGGSYTVLRPEAHALYLAAHALLQHGEADFQLLRYYDLHCLMSVPNTFDWRLIVDQAVELAWTFMLARALSLTMHYFHTPVPAWVLPELQDRRPAREDTLHVVRRQQPRSVTQAVVDDLVAMSVADRLRTLGRVVLPAPAYMRWRYALDADWQLPVAYLRRWIRIGGDVAKTARERLF